MSAAQLWELFQDAYLRPRADGIALTLTGDEAGAGSAEALAAALAARGCPVEVLSLHRTGISTETGRETITFAEYRDGGTTRWTARAEA
jgi:hypothetical protein